MTASNRNVERTASTDRLRNLLLRQETILFAILVVGMVIMSLLRMSSWTPTTSSTKVGWQPRSR